MLLRQDRPTTVRQVWARLATGSAVLFTGQMLANGLAYCYLMLVARIMTPSDYGILVTLTSTSFVLAVLMRTIQAWVVKAVAILPGVDSGDIRALFTAAARILIPVGTVVLILHWLASGWVADFLHLGSTAPVVILGLYSATSLLVPVPRGVLLGVNRLHAAGVVNVVEAVARLFGGLALVVVGLGVQGALAAYSVGNVVSFIAALVVLWPLFRQGKGRLRRTDSLKGIDRYAGLLLIGNTCLMVVASIDQVAVKHYFSDQVAGNYAVAFLLGRVIALSTVSLGWVIFARSATLPVNDARRARLFYTAIVAIGALSALLTAGYLVLPRIAIRLMGGSQYASAANYVGMVGIEMTLFALIYVQSYYLMSVKKMVVVWPLGFAVICEVFLLEIYHSSVQQLLVCLIAVLSGLLIGVSVMSWFALRESGQLASMPVRETARTAAKTV